MKVELFLAVALVSLCIGERQQRSTVLTDESKRVVEHFDFSNFDNQEALNYLDRQRYENQVRGKRSHTKSQKDLYGKIQGINSDKDEVPDKADDSRFFYYNSESLSGEPNNYLKETETKSPILQSPNNVQNFGEYLNSQQIRCKRNHHNKKHRSKISRYDNDFFYDTDELEVGYHKKKKKKKRHYWDKWSEWSPCSVTCGRGRKIRWRKCVVENCSTGEVEMGEKTCQLPACSLLTKLLGI